MADPPETLSLLGYTPHGQHGFALPFFASNDLPNTWYIANCSVSTDHLGTIVGFEAIRIAPSCRLPSTDVRHVKVGDPWCDVFLWNSEVYVGRPRELWTALRTEMSQLRKRAPLTLLDLALFAEHSIAPSLIQNAFEYVDKLAGAKHALAWRRDLLLRPFLVRLIQRRIFAGEIKAPMKAARQTEIFEIGASAYCVQIPEEVVKAAESSSVLDGVLAEFQEFAAILSINIIVLPHVDAGSGRKEDILIFLCNGDGKLFQNSPSSMSVPTLEGTGRSALYSIVDLRETKRFSSDSPHYGPVIHIADFSCDTRDLRRYRMTLFVTTDSTVIQMIGTPSSQQTRIQHRLNAEGLTLLSRLARQSN